MKIDCVVLTKDRPDLMMDLRQGLLAQQEVDLRVVVVDNGGEPRTGELVQDWQEIYESGCDQIANLSVEPEWVYVREKIKGFGEGVNLAASVVPDPAPALLLLNNDVALSNPRTIYNMAHHLGPAGVGVVGCRLVESTGLINHDGVGFHQGVPYHMRRGAIPERVPICVLTPAVTFACALIDRELFDAAEGLDEGYGWGYEDTDFCLRAAELDYLIVTCRRTSAEHNEFGTRVRGGDQNEMHRFFGKWAATGRGERALTTKFVKTVSRNELRG